MSIPLIALPYLITALIDLALIGYALSRRKAPTAWPLIAMMASAFMWSFFYGMMISVEGMALKVLFSKLTFLGLGTIQVLVYLFARAFTGQRGRIPLPAILVTCAYMVVTIAAALMGDAWPVLRHGYYLKETAGISVLGYTNGPLFYAHIGVSLLFVVFNLRVARHALTKGPAFRRRPAAMIIASCLGVAVVDYLFQLGITPVPGLNFSSATMSISSGMIAVLAIRYRMFAGAYSTAEIIMDGIYDLVLIVDAGGILMDLNREARGQLGLGDDAIGAPAGEGDGALASALAQIQALCPADGSGSLDVTMRRGGETVYYEASRRPILTKGGKRVGEVIQLRDVTERRQTLAQLQEKIRQVEDLHRRVREEAIHDHLTGLYNRRYLAEMLDRMLALARRESSPMAFVMADLDHFKELNDTKGHQAGDRVLIKVGEVFRQRLRASDIAYRYGGEEFLAILPDTDLPGAMDLVEGLRLGLREALGAKGLTMSFGVSVFPRHGAQADALVKAADDALYAAKARGRDRVETADSI